MIQIKDTASVRGEFSMNIYRRGKLIEEYAEHNLIVNGARQCMAHLVAGETAGKSITSIAFGVAGDAPTPENASISGAFVKPVSGFSYPETSRLVIDWHLSVDEANGMAIKEFGLLAGDGTLFARKNRAEPINKSNDISIDGQWVIIF
jgi:hypothetical protein